MFVANAGVAALGKLGDFAAADIDDALAVNLRTPILMAHQLVRLMQQRAAGHIVFIGSIGGRVPAADAAIYDATKFGLRGFALGLRVCVHDRCTGVSRTCTGTPDTKSSRPSTTRTPINGQRPESLIRGPQSHSGMSGAPPYGPIWTRASTYRVDHRKARGPERAAGWFDPASKLCALVGGRG